jgi:hypothetical protein
MSKIRQSLVLAGVVAGTVTILGQGPAVKTVMRDKLGHTQKILEAVVTSDWAGLEAQTQQLEQLTKDPRWTVLRYPEYAKYSAAFVEAVQVLHAAAVRRDLEQTPKAYTDVTLQCVECHRYLARARVAGVPPN